jgi:hypothetical protein
VRIVNSVEGSWRTIRVVDADPSQRAALAELGFGADLVRRYPPDTRYFDRAVANLGQWLDEMVGQRTTGTAPGWAGALGDLLDRAARAQVPVAVVGSVALAVRGVDVRPGDIDVITTVEGTDELADCYQDVLVVPVADEPGFGRWGRAFAGGICVEWLGTPAGASEGPWPLAAAQWSIASPFEEVCWEKRLLRVPPLEVQRQVEVLRQRPDRVAAIDEYRIRGLPRKLSGLGLSELILLSHESSAYTSGLGRAAS